MNKNYFVRYGILDSNLIFNECGPYSGGPEGWDEESIKKREEVALRYIKTLNDDRQFYIKLEKSILKEGFRNPILVTAGYCPKIKDRGRNGRLPIFMQQDHSKILTCNINGGSRLWIAQKHNLEIPCIISDFVDRFTQFRLLKNIDDIFSCYKDKPQKILVTKDGIRVRFVPHYHMKE